MPTCGRYLSRLLAAQRYEVDLAPDGENALAMVGSRKPDAILADIMMPHIDGFEFLRRLRSDEATRDIPVILLVGARRRGMQGRRAGSGRRRLPRQTVLGARILCPDGLGHRVARITPPITLAAEKENERIRRLFRPGTRLYRGVARSGSQIRIRQRGICAHRRRPGSHRQDRPAGASRTGRTGIFRDSSTTSTAPASAILGRRASRAGARAGGGALDQRFVDFVCEPILDDIGKPVGIFIEGHDVTEHVMAEAALRDSEERFRTLADNISTLCWMAEPDGSIFWFNSRWYDYTGMRPADQEGWGWQTVHDPESSPLCWSDGNARSPLPNHSK